MNLKDRKLQEAKTKLKVLEEKLKFLEFSNLQDKEEKIIDCKHILWHCFFIFNKKFPKNKKRLIIYDQT